MELKEAKLLTKSYTQNSIEYTPALSDDWEYELISYHNENDKIKLTSKKLGLTTYVVIAIHTFFRKYIFTEKIKIDKNKFIGEFAFCKYDIVLKEDFEKAQEIVSNSELNESIPNDELIEFGLYIDDKGESFVYLGNYSFNQKYFKNIDDKPMLYSSIYKEKKARYIIKVDKDLKLNNWNTNMIQKNSNRKFIEFVKILNNEEINKFLSSLFNIRSYGILSIIKENGNKIIPVYTKINSIQDNNNLYKVGDTYYYYIKQYNYERDGYNRNYDKYLFILDNEKLKSNLMQRGVLDIKDCIIKKISDNYIIEKLFSDIDENETNIYKVNYFIDYE